MSMSYWWLLAFCLVLFAIRFLEKKLKTGYLIGFAYEAVVLVVFYFLRADIEQYILFTAWSLILFLFENGNKKGDR